MTKYLYIGIFLVCFSCNKDKRASDFLIKGVTWDVSSLTVDGNALPNLGTWEVSQGVDIYKGVPEVIWSTNGSNSSIFEWQFHEKANKFQLNYKQDSLKCDGVNLGTMDYQTYRLTGTYTVEKHRNSKMIFKSSSTIGYPNKEVIILIEK